MQIQSFLARIVILIILLPLLAIAGFLGGVASYNFFLRTFVRPKELREVKPKGDLLVKALIRFQAANGEFPERIEDIVPAYVEKIPQVAYGSGHWEYIRNFGVSPSPNFWLQVRNKEGRRNEGYHIFVTKGRHGVNLGSWQYDNSLSDITETKTDGNTGTG